MNKLGKITVTVIPAFFISFSLFPQALGGGGDIWLDFEGRTLSARLNEAPLRQVIDRIKREHVIWIKRIHGSFNAKISVQFEDLPLRTGIERIFSVVNYSLVFDGQGKLAGIFLVGKPLGRWGKFQRRSIVRRPKRVIRRPRPHRTRR
jgi:hypothetical protein